MWEKWVFLAVMLAGSTCLMRAPAGHITAAPGGAGFIRALREEIAGIAAAAGHAPRAEFLEPTGAMMFAPGSTLHRLDAARRPRQRADRSRPDHRRPDHRLGAEAASLMVPLLRVVYTHLKAYELQLG